LFRFLLLLVLLGTAFVMIEPRWSPDTRTLTLRVRSAAELVKNVQGAARALGDKAAERVAGAASETPPVASAPPEKAAESERHSDEERARLDRLVEEKTRTP
jgi:predicted component of type VI protein secretion system